MIVQHIPLCNSIGEFIVGIGSSERPASITARSWNFCCTYDLYDTTTSHLGSNGLWTNLNIRPNFEWSLLFWRGFLLL